MVGERIAAWFLSSHGLHVLDSNLTVGGGEVDLVALDGRQRVVIEVRASTTRHDPIDAVDDAKRRRVRLLASRLGAHRADFIGVGVSSSGIDVHWVPGL